MQEFLRALQILYENLGGDMSQVGDLFTTGKGTDSEVEKVKAIFNAEEK